MIIYQDGKIIDQYESLVNPERSIPTEITRITGIHNEMVANAPKFYEIAKVIIEKTEGCVFVAHNVFFDYNFICEEFLQLGYSYSRKKLCTVQLSRRYFKGLKSYSLGNLITHFNIEVRQRHRAMEDTRATLEVFKRILDMEQSAAPSVINLAGLLQDFKLPANLNRQDIQKLPELPGIYYMIDAHDSVIYVGKSKSIRDRIIQHLNDRTAKTQKMLLSIHHIDFKLTGNELMASLYEASEIKRLQPEINRALRRKTHSFYLIAQTHPSGFYNFAVKEAEWLELNDEILNHYSTRQSAKEHLEHILHEHRLCKKVNDQAMDGKPCYGFQIGLCHGACVGKEDVGSYNLRFEVARRELNNIFSTDFAVFGRGREPHERSCILVEGGFCSHIGYLSMEENYTNREQIADHLEHYNGNVETNRIITHYLNKTKDYQKEEFTHYGKLA